STSMEKVDDGWASDRWNAFSMIRAYVSVRSPSAFPLASIFTPRDIGPLAFSSEDPQPASMGGRKRRRMTHEARVRPATRAGGEGGTLAVMAAPRRVERSSTRADTPARRRTEALQWVEGKGRRP